jgi:hypothetical protein
LKFCLHLSTASQVREKKFSEKFNYLPQGFGSEHPIFQYQGASFDLREGRLVLVSDPNRLRAVFR